MLNIINLILLLLISNGGILLNKGLKFGNFIYLLSVLTVWLLRHTLIINKSKGLTRLLHISLSSRVLLAIKTKSLLLFYIFFEFSVIPITLILYLFGYQPEKLNAALLLMLYTLIGSLPLLLYILYGSAKFNVSRSLLTIPITLAFLIKSPLFLFHTWLPLAHVEAPVGGSMVLAGVLLKLGTYGLLTFLPTIRLNNWLLLVFALSLLGSIIGAIICLRQGDMKALIAYSSVVHIGFVTIGLVSGTEVGYSSALIMVLAHGICSPFIFSFSYFLYSESHSRILLHNVILFPLYTAVFFGLISLNISVPPRLRLWSEVILSVTILSFATHSLWLLIVFFFVSVLYNLYLFCACCHGKFSGYGRHFPLLGLFPTLQVLAIRYSCCLTLSIFHS